jgi:luciferase family oxidoreductase group 1
LKVAESFRVLEALAPGRVDLGIGRAPGTDTMTALALRRSREALAADDFPEQLAELRGYNDPGSSDHPFMRIKASPSDVPLPPIWILGSSDYGARLAAALGLPFSFASHMKTWRTSSVSAISACSG